MRPVGTLYWGDGSAMGVRSAYLLQAEPHVMIRVKRIFGRVKTKDRGSVYITDTPEVARDLVWLLDRFPLTMSDGTREHLLAQARVHRDQERTVERVLAGTYHHVSLMEPARPTRDYQQQAVDLAVATGRLLCTDELGLGKSAIGALVLGAPDALPGLVVTLTHLPRQWVGEIHATYPSLRCHIATQGIPYDIEKREGGPVDVIVMNYHKLAGWKDVLTGVIRTIIFDEAQELRRWGTGKYDAAMQIASGARFRIGLTATPVYNYGGEIHNLFEILAPDVLGSRDEFVREWGAGSYNDHVAVNDPHALGNYLRSEGLMLGRTRKEVGRELPEVIRVVQPIDADEDEIDKLTGNAVELAQLILASSTESKERWKASGDLDWKLRQATGIAKAPYVAAFVRMLLESEERVVLFAWHRAVYDLWAQLLKDHYPAFYTGTESPNQKHRSAQAFLDGDTNLLIMSNRSGAGLDGLQEVARVAVFGELDWSPQVHNQCIGRLHRDGQDEPVVAYFLVSETGSDPVIADVLNLKRMQSEPMLSPDGQLFVQQVAGIDRVKRLAAEVLARAGVQAADSQTSDEDEESAEASS